MIYVQTWKMQRGLCPNATPAMRHPEIARNCPFPLEGYLENMQLFTVDPFPNDLCRIIQHVSNFLHCHQAFCHTHIYTHAHKKGCTDSTLICHISIFLEDSLPWFVGPVNLETVSAAARCRLPVPRSSEDQVPIIRKNGCFIPRSLIRSTSFNIFLVTWRVYIYRYFDLRFENDSLIIKCSIEQFSIG